LKRNRKKRKAQPRRFLDGFLPPPNGLLDAFLPVSNSFSTNLGPV
jgi:hypothetical protein